MSTPGSSNAEWHEMKKRWSILIFAAGLGIGCWVGSGRGSVIQVISSTHLEQQSKLRESRPTTTPHDTKWQSFGKSVARMSHEDQEAVLEKLDSLDWAAAMEAILAQAGPEGLDHDMKEMLTSILTKWGVEDFDRAWEWTQSCEPEAMQIFAVKTLLEDLAKREPEKALMLYYRKTSVSPQYESDVPEILMKASAGNGADEFVKLLGRFKFSASERTGMGTVRRTSVEFAPDFDFRQVADATVKLMEKHGGEMPERFPYNFTAEWGKKDLAAADDWVMKNPELPFNEWSNLYLAAQESLGTEAAGAWMAAKLESAGDRKTGMMEMLINFSSAANIKAIAAVMPDMETRDRFIEDLVAASGGNSSENNIGIALTMLSSPTARLAALRRMPASNDWLPDDEDLEKLGITRAQLNEIVPPREE